MNGDSTRPPRGSGGQPSGAGGSEHSGGAGEHSGGAGEFGRLVVERSGGIGGFLLVWELDIDASSRRDDLGQKVAGLQWSPPEGDAGSGGGADRFDYLIESRFGRVRFGEGQMPQEWRQLVDEVRAIAEPQRRRPGAG